MDSYVRPHRGGKEPFAQILFKTRVSLLRKGPAPIDVVEDVADDLEIAMNLLISQAQAALHLLSSRLPQQPEPALAQEYEPARLKLEEQLASLTRIKSDA